MAGLATVTNHLLYKCMYHLPSTSNSIKAWDLRLYHSPTMSTSRCCAMIDQGLLQYAMRRCIPSFLRFCPSSPSVRPSVACLVLVVSRLIAAIGIVVNNERMNERNNETLEAESLKSALIVHADIIRPQKEYYYIYFC